VLPVGDSNRIRDRLRADPDRRGPGGLAPVGGRRGGRSRCDCRPRRAGAGGAITARKAGRGSIDRSRSGSWRSACCNPSVLGPSPADASHICAHRCSCVRSERSVSLVAASAITRRELIDDEPEYGGAPMSWHANAEQESVRRGARSGPNVGPCRCRCALASEQSTREGKRYP